MRIGADILKSAAGEAFERDFAGGHQIVVLREGHSHARHLFISGGRVIAKLRWRGLRRALYEAEGAKLEITIGPLQKRITAISEDGGESLLIERSSANPHCEKLRIEMAEGDNFCLVRRAGFRSSEAHFEVRREFRRSPILIFSFDSERRTQTTAHIRAEPNLRWESRFAHRLLALVVCRIILERRHSGSQPIRIKEAKPRRAFHRARRKT
jgi:hypothetical protein